MMINVGGLLPFTMIDFPGKLSAVVFCQGCPLNCPYCHNPNMQHAATKTDVTWKDVLGLLKTRKNLLDGIVFSGGEPLMQPRLNDAIKQVKDMGFLAALHTSGVLVDRLREVLPNISWIGLDIKAPFSDYAMASGTRPEQSMGQAAERALDLILESGILFEVRTTTDPRIINKEKLLELAKMLASKGVKTYAIQEYRPAGNGRLEEPSEAEIVSFYEDADLLAELKSMFSEFIVRRA